MGLPKEKKEKKDFRLHSYSYEGKPMGELEDFCNKDTHHWKKGGSYLEGALFSKQ